MNDLFGLKEEIEKDEFIRKWEDSERKRDEAGEYDGSAHKNLEEHKKYSGVKYYRVILTKDGLNNLVLPYHVHPKIKVSQGGEAFWRIISKYLSWVEEGITDACIQKLLWIKHNIIKFNESEGLVEAEFMFSSSNRDLAMPGYYIKDHGENKLYAGNFHQFIAYGLWIKDNSYKPIKTYYCKKL